jgi:3-oxoacyl-[acyl-carrier protein] reductase
MVKCFCERRSGKAGKLSALEAYTRSPAIELGPDNITVNCIAPGPVQTGWIDESLKQEILPSIPLKSIGRPEDIAQCVVFLSSKQASWITGEVIKVSGGMLFNGNSR